MNNRQIGNEYEDRAVLYLEQNGYEILKRNYRNRIGEIDIIAKDIDNTIVYIEVKYRRSNRMGNSLEAVNYRKQQIISRVALFHQASLKNREHYKYRFDVIGIDKDNITHIKNAFEYTR